MKYTLQRGEKEKYKKCLIKRMRRIRISLLKLYILIYINIKVDVIWLVILKLCF